MQSSHNQQICACQFMPGNFSHWVDLNEPVLLCELFHVGEVSALPCMAGVKAAGVSASGCQKTAGVIDCLGSKQKVSCSLFMFLYSRTENPGDLELLSPLNLQISAVLDEILARL